MGLTHLALAVGPESDVDLLRRRLRVQGLRGLFHCTLQCGWKMGGKLGRKCQSPRQGAAINRRLGGAVEFLLGGHCSAKPWRIGSQAGSSGNMLGEGSL